MAAPPMPGAYVGPQGMDAAQITEQKGKAEAYLQNQCKAAIDMAVQQRDHQRSLIQAETDRAIQLLTSQLTSSRDQALMQLEQSFLQHKMGLDQEQSMKRSEIEQAALFMTAQAQHSQAQKEMSDRMAKLAQNAPAASPYLPAGVSGFGSPPLFGGGFGAPPPTPGYGGAYA